MNAINASLNILVHDVITLNMFLYPVLIIEIILFIR